MIDLILHYLWLSTKTYMLFGFFFAILSILIDLFSLDKMNLNLTDALVVFLFWPSFLKYFFPNES